ncbi:MAG: YceH family protein [Bacillota bacterium]
MEYLNATEARVIGSLIEKELTTPEYYPLSLNALTNACNQKSSREPVVSYSEEEVENALTTLREKKLARMVQDGGRVVKYKEALVEQISLDPKETAVLTLLILRGPQTAGELRSRSGRMYEFQSLEEVELTLQNLSGREADPLVVKLERQTGMKERRYAHLLCGPVNTDNKEVLNNGTSNNDKFEILYQELDKLKLEFELLKEQFSNFKKQFE